MSLLNIITDRTKWCPLFLARNSNSPCIERQPNYAKRFCLARDTENGRKEFLLLTEKPLSVFDDIRRIQDPNERVFYEYVVGPQKMHLDLDFSSQDLPHLNPDQFDRVANVVFRAACYALTLLSVPLREVTGTPVFINYEDLVVAESHRAGKYSWHVLINSFYLRSNVDAKILFEKCVFPYIKTDESVIALLNENLITEAQLAKCVDHSVFSSKQQWRMLHCRKRGVPNAKRLANEFEVNDVEFGIRVVSTNHRDWDTLVGLYPRDAEANFIDIIASRSRPSPLPDDGFAHLKRTKRNTPVEYFEALLDLIDPRYWTGYSTWMDLIGAMWNFYEMNEESLERDSEDFQRIVKYSRKTTANNFSEAALFDKLSQFVIVPWRTGWTTVKKYATESNPQAVAKVVENFAKKKLSGRKARAAFLSNEGPFWEDLTVSKDGFCAVWEDSPQFLRKCQKIFAVLQCAGERFWLLKSQGPDGKVRRIERKIIEDEVTVRMKPPEKKTRGRPPGESVCLSDYLRMHRTDLITFTQKEFIPYTDPTTIKENVLNTFEGFEALKVPPPSDRRCIEKLIHHIKHIWCSDNEEHFEYVMRWFAYIFRFPRKKTGVILVIYSEKHGAGKGIVTDFIKTRVIGDDYCYQAKSWNELLDKFNSTLEDRILTVGDELSATDMKVTRENFCALKNMITSPVINVNAKYKVQITGKKDYNNYIITTNSKFSTIVEPWDRRTFCLSVSNERAGDRQYFNELLADMQAPEAGRAFYDYLSEVHIPEGWTPDHPPSTPYREQQIGHSGGPVMQFLINAYCNPLDLFSRVVDKFGEGGRSAAEPRSGWILTKELFDVYKQFCDRGGYRVQRLDYFLSDIAPFGFTHFVRAPRGLNVNPEDTRRPDAVKIDVEVMRRELSGILPNTLRE